MRTILVALAVSVADSDTLNLPKVGADFEEFKRFLTWTAVDPTVVGVYDRDQPINNDEPQIFASFGAAEADTSPEASGRVLRCAC